MDKKFFTGMFLSLVILLIGFVSGQRINILQETPAQVLGTSQNSGCVAIQSGSLTTSDGRTILPGYDEWGYNYQARLFNGGYCDAYRDAAWCQPYKDVDLSMKWNDAWLSNRDCDNDGLLDRHFGSAGYIGSGAWLTNHQFGSYEQDGNIEHWNYFVKIAAVPTTAVQDGGFWKTATGKVIGPVIWGEFAVLQSVYNDTGTGEHGIETRSPIGPGFGKLR